MSRPPIPTGTKKQVFEKCNNECQLCGWNRRRDLELHHIIPYHICKSHDPANLMVLCKDCHSLIGNNKLTLFDHTNRKTSTKWRIVLMRMYATHKDDGSCTTLLLKMYKSIKNPKNPSSTSKFARVRKYLTYCQFRKFEVEVSLYQKATGDLDFKWEVYSGDKLRYVCHKCGAEIPYEDLYEGVALKRHLFFDGAEKRTAVYECRDCVEV